MERNPPSPASMYSFEKPSVRSSVLDDAAGFADPTVIRGHVQQLHLLTSRIEEFLSYQIHRLQTIETAAAEPQVSTSAELDRMIDEFEQLRRNWEVERQSEQDRLKGDAERLQAAWRDLELEQRQLLTRQAAMRSTAASAMSVTPAATPVAVGAMYPARSATPTRAVTGAAVAAQRPVEAAENAPSHRAQIQFQQLRREMQKHAQQRNKR